MEKGTINVTIRFAVIGINHNHILGQVNALLGAGATFAGFFAPEDDLAADFARMNAEPIVKQWYAVCGPCQVPLATRKEGEWWADMDEVFHME